MGLKINEDLIARGSQSLAWRAVGVIHLLIHAVMYFFRKP